MTGVFSLLRRGLAALALLAMLAPVAAVAQPQAAQTLPQAVTPASAAQTQAAEIAALMSGRLATDVDASRLFTSSLSGAGALRVRWVAKMISEDRLFQSAKRDPSLLTGLAPDEAALAVAQAEFLRLPAARRTALIATHTRRQAEASQAVRASAQTARQMSALREIATGLQAFLDGTPAAPASLTIDLLDPAGSALSRDRRQLLLDETPRPAAAASAPPANGVAGTGATIDAMNARIDALRNRILHLPSAERNRLTTIQVAASTQHQAEVLAVARAKQQLAVVKASAAQAQSETERFYFAERQRLLTIKKSLAATKLALAQQSAAIDQIWETALGWRRQVNDISPDASENGDADRLYWRLIDALRGVRRELGDALGQRATSGVDIPVIPPFENLIPRSDPRAASLQQLHDDLTRQARQLGVQASASGWARRTALFNAMTEMNAARLALLPSLSDETHARVTGFDEEGLAQVQREFNQMTLTTRYNVALGVKRFGSFGATSLELRSEVIFGLIKLLALAVGFRLWRRRGDAFLASLESGYAERQPQTLASSFLAFALGLIRKVRRSLDWLLLLLGVRWLAPELFDLAVVAILWLILVWLLAASVIIQLIDAIAQDANRDDPRAHLRKKSLRLVFGLILGVGLVLSLTTASVGHGAIYSWVLSFCWLLVIPVVIVLTNWWRDRINALATLGSQQNAILTWTAAHPDGLAGILGRIMAGGLLLIQGGQAFVAKRINQLALIREISGQRSRDKAAARVVADEASGRYVPIPIDQAARLAPHDRPAVGPGGHMTAGQSPLPELRAGHLVAVIGERGLGKTTAIAGLFAAVEPARTIMIAAGTDGFDGIVRSLAEALNCAADVAAVSAKLAAGSYFIAVDDTQRLIVPAIGGLAAFDRLIALARKSGARSGWAFAVGGPAWSYLSRARADRTLFDDVVVLKRWNVADIRGLIERRTEQAGLAPAFNLEVYKAGTLLFDSEISPEERARRGFFEELTSQSDGNPAVALEFWRRSLFDDREAGCIAVRTYKAPSVTSLLALPKAVLFVLRAILQMEIATTPNIIQSTDLPSVVVAELLHALVQLGVVVATDDGYRLTLYWFQDVRHMLERQNLIVRNLP